MQQGGYTAEFRLEELALDVAHQAGVSLPQSWGESRDLPASASENPAEQNPQTSHHAGRCFPWAFPSPSGVGRQSSAWR